MFLSFPSQNMTSIEAGNHSLLESAYMERSWIQARWLDMQEMDFALEDGFTGEEEVLISNYKDVIRNENGIHLRPYEAKVFYRK